MGLVKMKSLSVVGLQSDKEKLLQSLLEMGVIEIREIKKEEFQEASLAFLQRQEDKAEKTKELQKDCALLKEIIPICRSLLQSKKSSYAPARSLAWENFHKEYSDWSKQLELLKEAQQLKQHWENKQASEQYLASLRLRKEALEPWLHFDQACQGLQQNKYIATSLYRFDNAPLLYSFLEALTQAEEDEREKQAKQHEVNGEGFHEPEDGIREKCMLPKTIQKGRFSFAYEIYLSKGQEAYEPFNIFSEAERKQVFAKESKAAQEGVHYLLLAYRKIHQNKLENIAKTFHGETMQLPLEYPSIPLYAEALEEEIKAYEDKIAQHQLTAKTLALRLNQFENLADFLNLQIQQNKAAKQFLETKHLVYFEGYLPEHLENQVLLRLQEEFTVWLDLQEISKLEDFPIAYRNPAWIAPYEGVTTMFSRPHAGELDPTPAFAPFYLLFYGMMFSDIGYGLLLSLITGFLLWGMKVKGESRQISGVLFQCGLSSAFWGLMFGGFFGNLLDTIGGEGTFPALWFNPTSEPIKLILVSVIFGLIHIFVALAVQIRLALARGQWQKALLDIFPWYLILGGTALYLVQSQLPDLLPISLGLYAIYLGVGILLVFSGRPSWNPLLRFVKGLGALYSITGYLSDLMSYTRILALALATSVIAMVVNRLGSMGGKGILGILLFILIGLLGHGLNFVLSALGAYVHSTRLQFVEFFGKFYEGGGRAFAPLQFTTDYVEVKGRPFAPRKSIASKLKDRLKQFAEREEAST